MTKRKKLISSNKIALQSIVYQPHLFSLLALEGKQQNALEWIQIHYFDVVNLLTWKVGDILGFLQNLSFVAKTIHFPEKI